MMPSSFQSDPTDQAFAVRDLSVMFGPKAAVDHLNLRMFRTAAFSAS
ncbi:ABC-2 type transport system ATP-binding protein [Corynebacterium diphtheriae PW8]|nr:ABC-2 type transport system ATP-binding protein [Corynebacterium diphtheriae PW8]